MKLSFFQAALIAIVTNATEVEEPSYEDMYFPDLLVQTDRLV